MINCNICDEPLTRNRFRYKICKSCVVKARKTRADERLAEKYRAQGFDVDSKNLASKAHRLKKKYGIDYEVYLKMYEVQKGLCIICETKTRLLVDHCHQTGKVRGLLCTHCNSGLGFFRDNKTALKNAIKYLDF